MATMLKVKTFGIGTYRDGKKEGDVKNECEGKIP